MSASESDTMFVWDSVKELLDADPYDISTRSPKLTKDIQYARAIQAAWKEEIEQRVRRSSTSSDMVVAEWTKVSYATDDTGDGVIVPLFGYCLRLPTTSDQSLAPVGGIVIFHTGAGPHDIFLLWKAESLLHELHDLVGYVLIADILSDETGWAWSPDRTRYDQVRDNLFQKNDGRRTILQQRVAAALAALCQFPQVDQRRIGALGWCLGGQPIWELAKAKTASVSIRCMATFHGVCDGAFDDQSTTFADAPSRLDADCSFLICNGAQDPFVPASDLARCIHTLEQFGHHVRLLEFPGAKHGFTNPAQAFNQHPAFDFNREASLDAWQQTLALFRERLSGK